MCRLMLHDKDHELPVKESFKSLQLGRQHFYNEWKADQILDQPIISLKVAVVLWSFISGLGFFFRFHLGVCVYVSIIEMNGR